MQLYQLKCIWLAIAPSHNLWKKLSNYERKVIVTEFNQPIFWNLKFMKGLFPKIQKKQKVS